MVHVNGIENFWSLLKRSVKGTQVHISPEHLHRYVDERAFAFNNRRESDLDRMCVAMAGTNGCRVTWKELVGQI
jgi:hypothetical protein